MNDPILIDNPAHPSHYDEEARKSRNRQETEYEATVALAERKHTCPHIDNPAHLKETP